MEKTKITLEGQHVTFQNLAGGAASMQIEEDKDGKLVLSVNVGRPDEHLFHPIAEFKLKGDHVSILLLTSPTADQSIAG